MVIRSLGLLTSMTGIILQLFDNVCVGKLRYLRASYCAHEESVLESDAGA